MTARLALVALASATGLAGCPFAQSDTKYFCRSDDDCDDLQYRCVDGRCKLRCECPTAEGVCIGEVCADPGCLEGVRRPEVCNGIDDDCDGVADDGDPGGGSMCVTGRPGVCSPGVVHCANGELKCIAVNGRPEECNGIDDDCDGAIDNEPRGAGDSCSTGLSAPCETGKRVCRQGGWACVTAPISAPEKCNGVDENCNGLVDEGNPEGGRFCNSGMPGRCAAGITRCSGGRLQCEQTQFSIPETCNDFDDDCDGQVDEGSPGGGAPCETGKLGLCAAGVTVCTQGALVCRGSWTPRPEICANGLDEDCSGEADSGPACAGCSDGTREGFLDRVRYERVAGCAGGFSVAGVLSASAPACGRKAGNNSPNPVGQGCNIQDLCADGWHVCKDEQDVRNHSPTGCVGVPATPPLFFITRQSGPGCCICATGTSTDPTQCTSTSCQRGCMQTSTMSNGVFGCGNVGRGADPGSCGAIERCSSSPCSDLGAPWTCGTLSAREAYNVRKTGPSGGGALCCRD